MRETLAFALLGLFFSCSAGWEVHLHDRHGLSWPAMREALRKTPGATLVLLDYHHDCGFPEAPLSSINWVGHLIAEGDVQHLIWVSGRNLEKPNRESRMNWLHRSLDTADPHDADRIISAVTLMDYPELVAWKPSGPVLVSLDLDILTKDPGPSPAVFLDELFAWLVQVKPRLVTVALSAAYQPDPSLAWSWLHRWLNQPWPAESRFFLETGRAEVAEESSEEKAAWLSWRQRPDGFQNSDQRFWPGSGVWAAAPLDIWNDLHRMGVRGITAEDDRFLAALTPERLAWHRQWPIEKLETFRTAANTALERVLVLNEPPRPEPQPVSQETFGLAVRLLGRGVDRGCLAFYRSVGQPEDFAAAAAGAAARDPRYPPVTADERSNLQIEISVFGPWLPMASPLDFCPGLDSLLLEKDGQTTLLQASLVPQRGWDQTTFLAHLSRKAGLGLEGWKQAGISFKKATTVWSLGPYLRGDQTSVKK